MYELILLFATGLAGGLINALAGGGGIIVYPVLLFSGLSPLIANATASFVALSGMITSVAGSRSEIQKLKENQLLLFIPAALGAMIGSTILIRTSPQTFEDVAVWLVLSAVILLALESRIHRWVSQQKRQYHLHWRTMPLIYLGVFVLSIYGGFFGPGYGLMMLALLGFTTLRNARSVNALKNLCGLATAGVATMYFVHAGFIDWHSGSIMALGSLCGGYAGARLTHRISTHTVHTIAVGTGLIVVAVLFLRHF